jgi:uncharacterized RDD family membrane protein YckC
MDNNNYQVPPDYSQMMPDYSYNDPYAFRVGFGRRLGAFLIDYLIFSLLMTIILFSTGKMDDLMAIGSSGSIDIEELMGASQSIAPLVLTLSLIYYSLEAFIGATLGKLTLGIKIASDNQTPAPIQKLLIRYIVKNVNTVLTTIGLAISFMGTIGSLLGFVVFIGYFFIFGQKKQGFHDMLAGTAVYYNEDIIKSNTGNL